MLKRVAALPGMVLLLAGVAVVILFSRRRPALPPETGTRAVDVTRSNDSAS